MKATLAVLALCTLPVVAEETGVQIWTATELQTRVRNEKPNAAGVSLDRLGSWGNHRTQHELSTRGGASEAHTNLADVIMITSGEITLLSGGVLEEPKSTTPGELRGKSIIGGTARKLSAGDIVHVLPNTPHSLTVEPGKQCTFFVVKIEVK